MYLNRQEIGARHSQQAFEKDRKILVENNNKTKQVLFHQSKRG